MLRPRRADEYDPVDGGIHSDTAPQCSPASAAEALSLRLIALLRSGVFISISVPFALGLTAQVGFLTHQVGFLSPTTGTVAAGWAVSLTTFAAVLGRIVAGYLADRFDRRAVACVNFIVQMFGMAILVTATAPAMLYLGCGLFGLGVGNTTSLPGLLGSAGVSKAAFRPDCQPRRRDKPVQLRIWTHFTRPARAGRRELQCRTACVPVYGSTGGIHCYLARYNSLQAGAFQKRGVEASEPGLALGLEAGIHSRFSKKRLVSILLTGIIAYGPKGPHGRNPALS